MSINPPESWVLIGKMGKPVGLDGSIRMWVEADLAEIVENEVPLSFWSPGKDPVEAPLLESAREDSKGWVAQWDGFDTREEAAALTHIWVVARRTDLPEPPEGSVYWNDLVGALLCSKEDAVLGTITGLFETAADTVLEVRSEEDTEFLVPLSERVDPELVRSEEAGVPHRLKVALPEGLVEATTTPKEEPGEAPKKTGHPRRRKLKPRTPRR